tara:strand:- start:166 stop:528 length:363 start_codon:yes stop_codon:yes gene_type:complete
MEMSTNKTNNKEQYEIILKLYNGLSGNLKLINQKVSKNKEDNSITQLAFKTDKIAAALQLSLDFENKEAKKLSENLRELYRHIRIAMKLIYENKNFELLKSASDVSFTLEDSWTKIRPSI